MGEIRKDKCLLFTTIYQLLKQIQIQKFLILFTITSDFKNFKIILIATEWNKLSKSDEFSN